MVSLNDLVTFLDQELSTDTIPDYPGALNGLQLENGGSVTRIVASVDASLPVIEKAVAGGPGLLLVHHGMFWQGARPLVGSFFKKVRTAMDAGLAIYSSHLPLDLHSRWGNNVRLAEAIGLKNLRPFLNLKGRDLGLRGDWDGSRDELKRLLEDIVGGPVHVCPGGVPGIRSIGVVTGGAGGEVALAAAENVDAFVTGEGPHWSYPLAEELGLNVFYAGHYATETFGVKALGSMLAGRYQLPCAFIDHPTGL